MYFFQIQTNAITCFISVNAECWLLVFYSVFPKSFQKCISEKMCAILDSP